MFASTINQIIYYMYQIHESFEDELCCWVPGSRQSAGWIVCPLQSAGWIVCPLQSSIHLKFMPASWVQWDCLLHVVDETLTSIKGFNVRHSSTTPLIHTFYYMQTTCLRQSRPQLFKQHPYTTLPASIFNVAQSSKLSIHRIQLFTHRI